MVSIFVARYLGTSNFGLFSYALAFVTIFQVPATLGLEEILVRELVKYPDDEGTILGTALGMRLISGFLTMGLIAIVVQFARPDDANVRDLVMVTSLLLIPQAFLVIQRLYIARVLAKYIVISGNVALTIVSVARLAMVHFHASLIWFVWTNVFFIGLTAIGLYGFYAAEKLHPHSLAIFETVVDSTHARRLAADPIWHRRVGAEPDRGVGHRLIPGQHRVGPMPWRTASTCCCWWRRTSSVNRWCPR